MSTQLRLTPEIRFCIQYLRENNVSDGTTFEACMKKVKPDTTPFRLVPLRDDDFFTELASKMRELWPTGKKDGKWDWRESVQNLASRLKWVWAKRELADYTIEDCLLVCRQYLSAYKDNTKYMKLLKYFIIRQKNAEYVGEDGQIHYAYESEFANMLENLTDEERKRAEDEALVESMAIDSGGTLL